MRIMAEAAKRPLMRNLALAGVAILAMAVPAVQAVRAQPASAEASARSIDPARLAGLPEFIDGILAQQLETREVAGAVVTVVQGGRILFTRGYGYQDVDKGVKVDPEGTLFRPGSTSKLFTWTALMQLVEQGKVRLDDPVSKYIDFKIPDTQSRPILVKHLFDHTPGFEDRGEGILVDDPAKFSELGPWLATHIPTRVREPGVESSYSNYGTALAGYIVQRVSGEPFPDYVERHIFGPLSMKHATFREPLPPALAPDMATGYKFVDGRFVAKPFEYFHNIMPAGSASATAPDMARFMIAHLHDGRYGDAQILKPETARLMHSNLSDNADGLGSGFAYGFFKLRDHGPRLIGHGGNTIDFHSMMVLAPEADFGFFISYTGGQGSYAARTELMNAIIGRVFPETPAPRWTGAAAKPLLGSYRTNRRTYSERWDPKDDLKIAAAGDRALSLEADGKKSYWVQVGPRIYEQVTGAREGGPYERMEFYGDASDPKLSFTAQPHVAYHLVKE